MKMRLEGQQIGRYRFERIIGRGGMGEVYLAVDPRIQQQVAVKVLQAETSIYPTSNVANEAERFRREASAIANLRHPNIVPLYDYNEASIEETSLTYLVVPYYKEGSFANWLRRRGSELLPIEDVAYFVQQAAAALQYAHNQHIIHRDVKPSNFLIDSSENPNRPNLLLADFGISKFGIATTGGTQSLGTLTYEAPEQFQGHPTYASDQYALAVMAYELLVGRPPFVGSPPMVIRQHMEDQPQPPSQLNPRLPRTVDLVLLRALNKKPENRYTSISEFASALGQALSKTDDDSTIRAESRIWEPQKMSEVREQQKDSSPDPEANIETVVNVSQSSATPPGQAYSYASPVQQNVPQPPGQAYSYASPVQQNVSQPTSPPVTPAAAPKPRRRRGLWIALGILGGVLLIAIILFAVIAANGSTPGKTLNAFCNSLKSGDNQTAFNQLSSGFQNQVGTEAQFAQAVSTNGGLGKVTDCTVSNVNDSAGSGTISYTFANGQTQVFDYVLIMENGTWKINSGHLRT
jgi:serine/threonine protein kinase